MNELTQDEHGILIDAIHDSATVIHKGQIMNKRIQELMIEAGKTIPGDKHIDADFCKKFAELIVKECIGILETEIELVKGYKSTACNDFDVRWHEGKIEHFAKLIEKSKKHFGVEE
jgi:hypothetical protein